jgi:hypothetical protein
MGRRPLLAAGNSNSDIPMLQFTRHEDKPFLRLLLLQDDADREFDYTGGAELALQQSDTDDWTVVSIKNDWATVFRAYDPRLARLRRRHLSDRQHLRHAARPLVPSREHEHTGWPSGRAGAGRGGRLRERHQRADRARPRSATRGRSCD